VCAGVDVCMRAGVDVCMRAGAGAGAADHLNGTGAKNMPHS
jgi:hypothetical protein